MIQIRWSPDHKSDPSAKTHLLFVFAYHFTKENCPILINARRWEFFIIIFGTSHGKKILIFCSRFASDGKGNRWWNKVCFFSFETRLWRVKAYKSWNWQSRYVCRSLLERMTLMIASFEVKRTYLQFFFRLVFISLID